MKKEILLYNQEKESAKMPAVAENDQKIHSFDTRNYLNLINHFPDYLIAVPGILKNYL